MAYVIVDTCTKDENCVEACPIGCIHPTKDEAKFAEVPQLYMNPDECTDCGACVPACDYNSIYPIDDLPENLKPFAEKNAAYYNWSDFNAAFIHWAGALLATPPCLLARATMAVLRSSRARYCSSRRRCGP